ncbi:hypothetical protein M3B04_11615, partial [Corynebacterium sanguinis]
MSRLISLTAAETRPGTSVNNVATDLTTIIPGGFATLTVNDVATDLTTITTATPGTPCQLCRDFG